MIWIVINSPLLQKSVTHGNEAFNFSKIDLISKWIVTMGHRCHGNRCLKINDNFNIWKHFATKTLRNYQNKKKHVVIERRRKQVKYDHCEACNMRTFKQYLWDWLLTKIII